MPIKETIQDISSLGGLPVFLVVTAVLLSGIGGENSQIIGGLLFVGLGLLFGIIALIRLVWFKERPIAEKHRTLLERIDASSFPSLHSARIALLAVVLAGFAPPGFRGMIWKIALLVLIAAVGYGRVRLKRHHWTDVIGGWILGILVGILLLWFARTY